MKKGLSVLLVAVMVSAFLPGCSKKKTESTLSETDIKVIDYNAYEDCDDIPDWDGEKIKLIKWVNAGSPASNNKGDTATEDVVSDELERITGISYDAELSYDNGGTSFDAKIAKIIASGEYPHVAEGIPDVSGLVKSDKLWNLEEMVKKYAPNLYKIFGPESNTQYATEWKNQVEKYGGIYALPIKSSNVTATLSELSAAGIYNISDEDLQKVKTNPSTPYPCIYVRDDILKQLYPQAHTCKELEAIYKKNGKFTEEEMFDVPLETPQDFIDMLYKIKDILVKNGETDAAPIFTHTGGDNWTVLCQLGGMFRYHTNPSTSAVNYFSYYDKKDQCIKYTFKEDWFKDVLKTYNQMVRDDVASKEALIDTDLNFKEKLNNGKYIVSYGNYSPDEAVLDGRYAYRTVFAKYKINTEDYLYPATDYTSYNRVSLFKDSLTERQAIQVVQMLDFMASKPGQKLMYWGPRKAGLFTTTEDGKLQYTDKALEDYMLQRPGSDKKAAVKYNLGRTEAWPGYFRCEANEYYPDFFYNEARSWNQAYWAGYIEEMKLTMCKVPNLYAADVMNEIKEYSKFWASRSGFEDKLTKIFAAVSDAEFEEAYKNMVTYAEQNGCTDAALEHFNKFYKEEYNSVYMDNLK